MMGVGAAAVMAVLVLLSAIELRRGRRIDQWLSCSTRRARRAMSTKRWRSYRRLTLSSIGEKLTRIPPTVLRRGWWLLAPIGFIASLGEVALLSSSKTALAIVVAIPSASVFAVLAVTRFEVFLMALIVVRASLDAFNLTSPDGGSTGIDPASSSAASSRCAPRCGYSRNVVRLWIKVSPRRGRCGRLLARAC